MSIGTLLGTIVGGVIALILFVVVVEPILNWVLYRWFGEDYIDRHGIYHRSWGE